MLALQFTYRAADWASFSQRSLVASPTSRIMGRTPNGPVDAPMQQVHPTDTLQGENGPVRFLSMPHLVYCHGETRSEIPRPRRLKVVAPCSRQLRPWAGPVGNLGRLRFRSDGALRLVLRQGCVSGCYGNREETPGLAPARSL